MPAAAARFVAHASGGAAHEVVGAEGFIDAAVRFAERWHPADGEEGQDGAVSVYVADVATGEQHCFRVDLDHGEVGPCAT